LTRLYKDAVKTPLSHVLIVFLFGVGLISLPTEKLFALFIADAMTARYISDITVRVILSVVAVVFIFRYGFNKIFIGRGGIVSVLAVIPAFLVAVNNAPIIGLLTGNVNITAPADKITLYVVYCLSVGVYEELLFRGIIFPLFILKTKDNKYGAFWAVVLTSLVFGLAHIVNLFAGGGIVPTLLQIGYSFLVGGMCVISMCITKNIFTAIILHAVYDVGGLITDGGVGIGSGNQWDTVTVIITVILSILVAVFEIIILFRLNVKELADNFLPEEKPETGSDTEKTYGQV